MDKAVTFLPQLVFLVSGRAGIKNLRKVVAKHPAFIDIFVTTYIVAKVKPEDVVSFFSFFFFFSHNAKKYHIIANFLIDKPSILKFKELITAVVDFIKSYTGDDGVVQSWSCIRNFCFQ